MNRAEFAELFEAALSEARSQGETVFEQKLPRLSLINLMAFGQSDKWISIEECLDFIYIDNVTFYRFIDVAVIARSETHTGYFVRPSGHPPGGLELTWQPEGLGPFKVMTSGGPLKQLVS